MFTGVGLSGSSREFWFIEQDQTRAGLFVHQRSGKVVRP
jgi:hypothetical protein